MMMKINNDLLRQIESDLSINSPYIKGKNNPIRNCWHFYSDGNSVDRLFDDREDFKDGMNRIFVVGMKYNIVILAFCLMDTHIHFVIYGDFNECNKFVHDFVRLTSIHIFNRHKERHKLLRMPINHQVIDSEFYLKSAICYVIKNAPVGGIPSTAYDYPWGSGSLYFRNSGEWTSPTWSSVNSVDVSTFGQMTVKDKRELLNSKYVNYDNDISVINGVVFPGEYVAYKIVERIFRTHKSFNFFMCVTKEDDIEKMGGVLSRLSIPLQEIREHRDEICKDVFSANSIRQLTTQQRLKLARILRGRFNCSSKQVCRVCGLLYAEVKELL